MTILTNIKHVVDRKAGGEKIFGLIKKKNPKPQLPPKKTHMMNNPSTSHKKS